MAVYRLDERIAFPPPQMSEESGLLAFGGDLSVERLVEAYSRGIFPWYSEGEPIMWFSPNPRFVLYPEAFKISRSLAKTIKSKKYRVSIDTCFEKVIQHCSEVPRVGQDGTWITGEMMGAYVQLHKLGIAHSFEVFEGNHLVGGLYGVSLGSAFFGESMFHLKPDASKVALHCLVNLMLEWGYDFIDAQVPTDHMKNMGAVEVERSVFLKKLEASICNSTRAELWSKR
jgi:leucyl/phenylalanyl-tRNA---protein transferase